MGGGKPAARQGDMTRKGLDIVQGSAGVLIGAPTGVACSVCPGGITYANPVNPVLGAKVLPGETDLALPCPLPFILFRAYSSYRTRTPAPVGVFGPGWKAPFDIRLQIRDEGLILNDSGGRSIHFEPLFPGEISYSRSESLWLARGGVMLYSMKVHPPLWRAGLRQNFRIFQNEDIKSILGTMLQENGVTEWSPLFSEPHPSREFCVQYGETDYDFLCRMAAEEGIFFYEEHAYKSTDQSLVLCDTVRHLPESFEIPWNPNTRTEVSTLCISQFRYSAQIRPSSVVTKDYTFKRPGWAGRFEQEGQHQDYQRTQYEVYDYPGRFKGAHGQNFARWQMDGWRNNAETARGMSRSPEIWPGRRIVLTGHPQANLNREWQVVASELHGEQPQAVPGRQGAGTALENHFAVIPADRTWRPQPLLKPLVDGPQSAVVTGPAGEEIFCDEHGRVRVKFNWDRYNPADQDSSCWIRVAQAWAGTGFGHLAIPRVGQEVIVDFLNGDPDQPIIMGRTYHQENRPPGSLPGTKTQMTIRSKTYMGSGFNELKFDDATGREQVYIHAQKNMDTEVLNDRTTTVKHDHRETVKNDQTVTIQEGNRLLTVEKGHKITGVLKGSLSEDVFQDRGTIAGSVHVDAVNNGGEGDGIQAYTAIKEILLAVEESKIALTPDSIQLQVGESTVIRLSKDGITIVGGSVFIN
ncbi:Vgr protein [Shigella sonnei]|nr:type VI secretion system tip protein TssI/VgrG [Shigella sonnei]CSZ89925.1 Vgr protein [Shigella sonnei]